MLQKLTLNSLNVKHQGKICSNQFSFMKTLKSIISEAYKVQVDCLKDSKSDSYGKYGMKEKVNDLVRLHEAM